MLAIGRACTSTGRAATLRLPDDSGGGMREMMVRSAVLAAMVLFVAGCGQQKPQAPEAPLQSPALARKTLSAELKDDRGAATLKVVARDVGPNSIEQEQFDQQGGEGRYIVRTAAVSMTVTIDGKPVDWLPAEGLYDPTFVELKRDGPGVRARVAGGDTVDAYFCDYIILGGRLVRRECGPPAVGEPSDVTTYTPLILE